MKQKLALAFEINNDNICLFLEKLKKYKNSINFDAVLLFYNNLSSNDINLIKEIFPCEFIKINKFKKTKFELFKYLAKFKTIIYTELYFELTQDFIKKYQDVEYATILYDNNRFVEFNFKKLLKNYQMFKCSQNTDVLILTDKIKNYQSIYHWCLKTSLIFYQVMRYKVPATLDLMLQKFNISVTPIINEKKEAINNYPYQNSQTKLKSIDGPLVTVLIPVYNRVDYIEDALTSIINQSYKNLEILIVLEYSDKQKEILTKLKKFKDKRIKIIQNKTKEGLAHSLNKGLNLAQGKYLARMDDDDISLLNRLEKQVCYLENNPEIGVVGTFMQFFGSSNLICELPIDNEILKVKCLYKTPLFHPTIMLNLEKLRQYDFKYANVYAEDYELWSRAIKYLKIANIPEVLYHYRLNNSNKSLQNEETINSSHHQIMQYQLKNYLNLELKFDDLQLLSGRIDVLGNSSNKSEVYEHKKKIWLTILKANNKNKFYSEEAILNEIKELDAYYNQLNNGE